MKVKSKFEIIEKLYDNSFEQISYFQNDITKFKIFLLVIKNHQQNINKTIVLQDFIQPDTITYANNRIENKENLNIILTSLRSNLNKPDIYLKS